MPSGSFSGFDVIAFNEVEAELGYPKGSGGMSELSLEPIQLTEAELDAVSGGRSSLPAKIGSLNGNGNGIGSILSGNGNGNGNGSVGFFNGSFDGNTFLVDVSISL
jgi:hypothetical protein